MVRLLVEKTEGQQNAAGNWSSGPYLRGRPRRLVSVEVTLDQPSSGDVVISHLINGMPGPSPVIGRLSFNANQTGFYAPPAGTMLPVADAIQVSWPAMGAGIQVRVRLVLEEEEEDESPEAVAAAVEFASIAG